MEDSTLILYVIKVIRDGMVLVELIVEEEENVIRGLLSRGSSGMNLKGHIVTVD